jgi:hypothetical protein
MSSVIKYYGNVFSNKVASCKPEYIGEIEGKQMTLKTCLKPLTGLINKTKTLIY